MEQNILLKIINEAGTQNPLPEKIYIVLIVLLLRIIVISGMPEVVSKYVSVGSLLECQNIHDELIETLFNDFVKYKQSVPTTRLKEVFSAIIAQTGQKFT